MHVRRALQIAAGAIGLGLIALSSVLLRDAIDEAADDDFQRAQAREACERLLGPNGEETERFLFCYQENLAVAPSGYIVPAMVGAAGVVMLVWSMIAGTNREPDPPTTFGG